MLNNEFERVKKLIERQIDFDNVEVMFKQDKKGSLKLSILRLSLRNPILKSTLQSSIISNVSKQIPKQRVGELYSLWTESDKDRIKREIFKIHVYHLK